jgi:phage terminase large subunit-like protein
MLQLGLRLGESRQIVTTTPKVQNVSLIKRIMGYSSTVTVTGSTYENMENLSAAFKQMVLSTYEGTRLGQQELYAKILEDVPGALWTRDIIEAHRVKDHPRLVRIVVAIDPATTSTEESCETGIIVAGRGDDGHGYVLGDLTRRDTPRGWAGVAIGAYEANNADRIVAEVNNGGDMVEAVIRSVDSSVAYKKVNASRGKRARAEPISALYEQGRIHHVGMFDDLEDQLCSYTPESKDSPDRMDALVWAFTELMLKDNSGWLETWGTGEKRELSLPEMTGSRRL